MAVWAVYSGFSSTAHGALALAAQHGLHIEIVELEPNQRVWDWALQSCVIILIRTGQQVASASYITKPDLLRLDSLRHLVENPRKSIQGEFDDYLQ